MRVAQLENADSRGCPAAWASRHLFAATDGSSGAAARASALRVLVCEDEWLIAMTIEDVLTDAGVEVVGVAPNSAAALALTEEEQPDYAIMDIQLQGGDDGVVLADRLWREHGVRSLFVSGNIDDSTRSAAGPARPVGFLSKPFSRAELLAAVKQIDPNAGGDGTA